MLLFICLLATTATNNFQHGSIAQETLEATPSFTKSHHAAHAVLNTNELLCNIVVCLPFEDVVNAANVCQTWRRALMDNIAIR
jgi:hypothetical protein